MNTPVPPPRRLLLDTLDDAWLRDRLPDDEVPLPRGHAAPADDFDEAAAEGGVARAAQAAQAAQAAAGRSGAGGAQGAARERWGELMLTQGN